MPVNSCLQFNGYEVSRLHYEPIETDISEFNLRPEFKKSITELDENNYSLTIRNMKKFFDAVQYLDNFEVYAAGDEVIHFAGVFSKVATVQNISE